MPKAIWNGAVLADARREQVKVVDGYTYFPVETVNRDYLQDSPATTVCQWKGTASYYTVKVGDKSNEDAAWIYRDPSAAARRIADHIAFWKGVEIQP